MRHPFRVPRSTYRLQITEDFDLVAAARTLGYLHELGVDWVYLSPLLASETGSEHGYDVSDHRAIDPSRGRAAGLAALSTEAHRLGMGVLVDIVPNHVGVGRPWENEWWWHVLTHGAESPYAGAFDIDWEFGGGKLRLPVLASDDIADDGQIAGLRLLGGELHYRDQRFPLAPDSVHGGEEDPNVVHARQHYQLVDWHEADTSLNYRRFFAVNSLAAIRVEDRAWFDKSHAEIGRWFAEGLVDGLRVDHPDGLRDPGKYLDDLAELTGGAYVAVEKILTLGRDADGAVRLEPLPSHWATEGTTGYDALALVDRVLVDPDGERPLTALENRLRGREVDWPAMVREGKLAVAERLLHSETRRIARELREAVEADGISDELLTSATAELLADFGVYRSYLPGGREQVDRAFTVAAGHRPELRRVLQVLHPVLADGAAPGAQRFQQTSGMVMAKGVEDCAFYRWSRLTSLNEVGGNPEVFAVSPAEFHELMAVRQQEWPDALTAGTTHDTKRGEDTRARISALAEVPGLWEEALEELLTRVPVPDPGLANLVWQAVVGAWPASSERLHGYVEKAMREAGEHTRWTAPDADFEAAMQACVDAVFDDPEVGGVVSRVADAITAAGRSNALAAKLLDLTLPGVPDLYQGSELWEHNLVDPDNRRPVDFAEREQLLAQVRTGVRPRFNNLAGDLGAVKLLLTHLGLTLRRDRPELFTGYTPLAAEGPAAGHVLAFDRGGAITAVTRLPIGLAGAGGWGETRLTLPEGRWVDVLSGGPVGTDDDRSVRLADLFSDYPVALLVVDERQPGTRGRFDVWAPLARQVRLQVGARVSPMKRQPDDWWRPAGAEPLGRVDYGYLVDDATTPVPDPRSRWQPDGVHGLSRSYDPSGYPWRDQGWAGRSLPGAVIYELHLGTFTEAGTLDAAIDKLDHLVELGVDFVELMPVNAFNGVHGWGYDGVAWSAVHEPYGGPDAYRRFVDAAHAAGLGVIQDVVYNHFGASGNYLPVFGPYLSKDQNAWGARINLDGPGSDGVRQLILENVRRWFMEAHVDGLRLDAVHELQDASATHLLAEISRLTAELSAHLRRPLSLIAEFDRNDPAMITPREAGGLGMDALWSDDFHHALHVALTGERQGYYADFVGLGALAKACERGFVRDGGYSVFRGAEVGHPLPPGTPSWRLVICSANHDQIGNRAAGDRPGQNLDADQLACAALLTLGMGGTPLIFMGEEWGATTPFPFFSDHPEPELATAVSQGRLAEFAAMGWDAAAVPDPQDPATFAAAKLDWGQLDQPGHREVWQAYRQLIALRREISDLTNPDLGTTRADFDDASGWFRLRRGAVSMVVNFSAEPVEVPLDGVQHLRWTTPSGAEVHGNVVRLPAHAGALLL